MCVYVCVHVEAKFTSIFHHLLVKATLVGWELQAWVPWFYVTRTGTTVTEQPYLGLSVVSENTDFGPSIVCGSCAHCTSSPVSL